jgi:hypothetical protein
MNVEAAFNYIETKGSTVFLKDANTTAFAAQTLKSPYSLSNKSPAPLHSDGRIKPDIYAPGTYILAGNTQSVSDNMCNNGANPFGPSSDVYFDALTHGPSYAAAVVSGMAALVREYLMNGYQVTGSSDTTQALVNPSASLVKAILLNGAVPLPTNDFNPGQFAYDDFTQCPQYNRYPVTSANIGFGFAQLSTSILNSKSGWKMFFPGHVEGSGVGDPQITQEDTHTYKYCAFYSASNHFQINITLAYSDPPSSSGASMALLNNLDLQVTYGSASTPYYGNGNSAGDSVNTVERVQLPAPSSTATYQQVTIKVKAASSLTYGKQNYSLVVTGWLSVGDCATALTPDGQNQSVVYTEAPTSAPCTSLVCKLTTDSNTYIAAIILLVTLIIVCCVCCCLGLFFVLAVVYSPMRNKAKGTSTEPIVSKHPYGSQPEVQSPTIQIVATDSGSPPAAAPAPPAATPARPSEDPESGEAGASKEPVAL